MRRFLIVILLMSVLSIQVQALDFQAPSAPDSVVDMVEQEADSFGEGLWNVIKEAIGAVNPSLREAASICLQITAALLVCGLVEEFSTSVSGFSLNLAGCAMVSVSVLSSASSLIQLGEETVTSISEYGKLLLPVMAGTMAAQGGVTSSTALYVATAFVDSLLSSLVSRLLIPLIWLYLALAIADGALGQALLGKMKAFVMWLASWGLKLVLYAFTGYMTITGVVSGSADAAAVKAAKITISGTVPVVGGILSDATEAVLVSANTLGSAAGVYGLLTVIALFAMPFFRIGLQYLLLKATAAVCESFSGGRAGSLVGDFASAMGLLLAMVSTQMVLLLISTVCFMKGVG